MSPIIFFIIFIVLFAILIGCAAVLAHANKALKADCILLHIDVEKEHKFRMDLQRENVQLHQENESLKQQVNRLAEMELPKGIKPHSGRKINRRK